MRYPTILLMLSFLLIPVYAHSAEPVADTPRSVSERIRSLRQTVAPDEARLRNDKPVLDETRKHAAASELNTRPGAFKTVRLRERLEAIENRLQRDEDEDGFNIANGDCDDSDPLTYPGAYEMRDNVDNDCDGVIDNPLTAVTQ